MKVVRRREGLEGKETRSWSRTGAGWLLQVYNSLKF